MPTLFLSRSVGSNIVTISLVPHIVWPSPWLHKLREPWSSNRYLICITWKLRQHNYSCNEAASSKMLFYSLQKVSCLKESRRCQDPENNISNWTSSSGICRIVNHCTIAYGVILFYYWKFPVATIVYRQDKCLHFSYPDLWSPILSQFH